MDIVYEIGGKERIMSSVFYGGTPIEQVNFEEEFDKEIRALADKVGELKAKKYTGEIKDYRYWTIKLARANKALEVGTVSMD